MWILGIATIMDVVQERLEREFNLELITTAPSVIYHVNKTDGSMTVVDNPADFPEPVTIQDVEEPFRQGTNHGTK